MSEMFCFQCQQTAGGSGCVKTGVCGKQPETAHLQDALVCRLIRLEDRIYAGWTAEEQALLLRLNRDFTEKLEAIVASL
mgnify:CR=1 FL=1